MTLSKFFGGGTIKGTKNFWGDQNLGGALTGGGTIAGYPVIYFIINMGIEDGAQSPYSLYL